MFSGMGRAYGVGGSWLLAGVSALALTVAPPAAAEDGSGQINAGQHSGSQGFVSTTTNYGEIWPAADLAQAEQVFDFDIESKPLPLAIADFSAVTGIQVLYTDTSAYTQETPPLRGSFTAKQALDRLIAETGLAYRFTSPNAVTLDRDGEQQGSDAMVLEPVVVYGARDATTLQDTSASVAVVTAEEIDYGQMQTIPHALRRMANVEKGATQNTGIVIRGMNFEGFSPAGAPMGSIYVDGILQTRFNSRFGARGLWDAEQVEVYRGPQSTLSGRAATAGAVYVKTKDPTFEQEAILSGTFGNKNLGGGAFVVNTPVNEKEGLALRVAGAYEKRTAEIDYPDYQGLANVDKFETELSANLRTKLLYLPDSLPDTAMMATYAFSKDRPNERLVDPGPGTRGDFYQFPTFAEFREIDVHNLGFELTHDFSDALRMTSQTSVSHGITFRESVDNGTPGLKNTFSGTFDDTLFSQEARLNYDAGRWNWVAGVFASYEYQDSDFFARVLELSAEQAQLFKRTTTNFAAFGEATHEVLPSWKVTVGGRLDYLREKTDETNILTIIPLATTTVTPTVAEIREVNFVPKIGISKEFNQNHVAGFTFTQGFRTGGFFVDQATSQAVSFDPEYADNYELFYKGRALNQRLQMNLNVFYTKYRDQQVESTAGPGLGAGTIVSNAASSYAAGFEFEPSFEVNKNLSVFASLGFLHTEFEEFDHRIYGDLSGEPFPEAPSWMVALGGRYTFDNGFYVGADAKYISDYTAKFSTNAPLDGIDARYIVNAQAGLRRDNWEFNAFAENLFDHRYFTITELESSPPFAQFGPNILFGANFKLKF